MNERIKELAHKADINIDSFQFSGTPIKHIVGESSLEKFAELIVRECANQVKDFYQEDEFTCYSAAETIKEHFGVEE